MDLVISPFHDYKKWKKEGFRTRDAHLFQYFSENENINKILLINRPESICECILKKEKWHIDGEHIIYKSHFSQITCINKHIYVLDILSLDFFGPIFKGKKWWNDIFYSKKIINEIKHAIDICEISSPVLLLQNPMAVALNKYIEFSYFVFDAIDNWLVHPQMKKNKTILKKNYGYIDQNASCITVVSKNLFGLFKQNQNKYFIPNGVDVDFFKSCDCHSASTNKIGYIGKIQERFDFDILENCLKKFPDYNFVIAGPILSCKNRVKFLIKKYRNVEFPGNIKYEQLPSFLHGIDIGIIPHVIDDFTSSMNPLKLYEYIAAGKVVITTKISGVSNISQYIIEANSKEDFVDKIELVKSKPLPNPNFVSASLPNCYTWKEISLQFISHVLNKKEGAFDEE